MNDPAFHQAPLAGKRILITGARGFLGTHLRHALQGRGAELHGLVRRRASNDAPTAGIRWWDADASDAAAVERVIGTVRPDVIFHMTSHAWGAPDLDKVLPTLENDLVATVNVMTSAARANVQRVITTGSMQEPEIVDGRCTPCSPYAAAKWAGAGYARMFHAVFGLPVVIVRPFMVYGPGQPPAKVIPYMIRSFLDGESPKVGDGSQAIDWIYVDDVVEGMIKAATANAAVGQTLELGSGQAVPLASVAHEIAALLGTGCQPQFGSVARPLEQLRVADTQSTERLLDWRPEISMREGLQRTIAYWRAQRGSGASKSRVALWGSVSANLMVLGDWARNLPAAINLA